MTRETAEPAVCGGQNVAQYGLPYLIDRFEASVEDITLASEEGSVTERDQRRVDDDRAAILSHVATLTAERDTALSDLSASRAREEGLREALEDCRETFELVEHPALVDPHYGAAVEALGERIGYGALMSSASASWRESAERNGYPSGGEYVAGPCFVTVQASLRRARSALEHKGE